MLPEYFLFFFGISIRGAKIPIMQFEKILQRVLSNHQVVPQFVHQVHGTKQARLSNIMGSIETIAPWAQRIPN